MPVQNNRNVVLMAALGTRPSALIAHLDVHPEIAAPSAMRLTSLFHVASRELVRSVRRPDAGRQEQLEAITLARDSCSAALNGLFEEVRRRTGARVVVLWDPDRMTFPFTDVSGIDVVLLCPARQRPGADPGPDLYQHQVADLIDRDIEGLLHRVSVWGVEEERIKAVHEDEIEHGDGYRDLLGFFDADASDAALRAMFIERTLRRSSAE